MPKPRWRTRANLTIERRTIEWLMDESTRLPEGSGYAHFIEVGKCTGKQGKVNIDLFGIFDLLGFGWFRVYGIQCTDYTHISHRRKKIRKWKNLKEWTDNRFRLVLLVGWKAPRKKGDEWTAKWEFVEPEEKDDGRRKVYE